MKQQIAVIASVLFMVLTVTACGASEPASAPSAAENDKAAVQEKLNKQDSKPYETKADDKQSDESIAATQAETESNGKNILVAYFSRADENYNVGTI